MMTHACAAISPILTNGNTGTNDRQQEVDVGVERESEDRSLRYAFLGIAIIP
jgi:hypothetical protein